MSSFKRVIIFILLCLTVTGCTVYSWNGSYSASRNPITPTHGVSASTVSPSPTITPTLPDYNPPTVKPTVKATKRPTPTPTERPTFTPSVTRDPNKKYLVYLSPSMQTWNIGYGDYGSEKKRMNQVADVVERILEEHDIEVFRNTKYSNIRDIAAQGISINPDIYLAIHSNACDKKTTGVEMWTHLKQNKSKLLCESVLNSFNEIYPGPNRGVISTVTADWPLYEVDTVFAAGIPMGLIELGFHDTKTDSVWVMNHIEETGVALAKGVLEYFEVDY